ncbi:MAG: hypothetical protein CVU03_04950 [Bacteroidetes bacterium HGW-Bacteroidetes-2]|jgi:hypothetical protein|nr:MAG: hypothetical protein CVU03_04950 [Bacteroidetes bacterium HGW-Bacteroidetes-2]
MNYYKARTIDTLPKLVFDLVATSIEQLTELGLNQSSIVVAETRLTDDQAVDFISYQHGICHLRIQNEALEAMPQIEIDKAEAEVFSAESVQKTREIEMQLQYEKFTYDGRDFPMTPGAVLVYQAIFDRPAEDHNIASATGSYTLLAVNISAFKAGFYARLIELNNAKIPPPQA